MPNNFTYRFSDRRNDRHEHDRHEHDRHDRHEHHRHGHDNFYPPYRSLPLWFWLLDT